MIASAEKLLVAPDHQVQIDRKETSGDVRPRWQVIWDRARSQANAQDLVNARESYLQLLELKPNIVEARWEFCKMLMAAEQWGEASQVLDGLLELEPDDPEYLMAAGNVAMRAARYNMAVRFYGHVYEEAPSSQFASDALAGMTDAFVAQKKFKNALLLLEQQHVRKPSDIKLLQELAEVSYKAGDIVRAKVFYGQLVDLMPEDKQLLFTAANLYSAGDKSPAAVRLWDRYLTFEKDYLPFHRNLADYYLQAKQPAKAISHLVALYEAKNRPDDLGMQIGDIYSSQLKRPDKALLYYERIVHNGVVPLNKDLSDKIDRIRTVIAKQYLPIVENNAAQTLWHDLGLVSLHKELIFEKMADILHQQGHMGLEETVLSLLYEHAEADDRFGYRFAKIKAEQKRYDIALRLLAQLSKNGYTNWEYLLLKSDIEMHSGAINKALESKKTYLSHVPSDMKVRGDAIILAGKLGLSDEVRQLWNRREECNAGTEEWVDLQLAFIEAERENGLFSQLDARYDSIIERVDDKPELVAKVLFHKSETFLKRRLVFEAEQVLRQIIAKDVSTEKALEKLVDISIIEEKYEKALDWLQLLQSMDPDAGSEKRLRNRFLKLRILLAEKEYEEARDYLAERIVPELSVALSTEYAGMAALYDMKITYFLAGKEGASPKKTAADSSSSLLSTEERVLQDLMSNPESAESEMILRNAKVKGTLSVLDLLEMSDSYRHYGANDRALNAVNLVLESLPTSQTALLKKIDILSRLSRYTEALVLLDPLLEEYPDQNYLLRLRLELEFKSGNFKKVVERVAAKVENAQKETSTYVIKRKDDDTLFWQKLMLARALWADNQREESIKVYNSLLASPVDTMFLEKMEVEKINFNLPPLKKSFWNYLTFSDPSYEESFNEMMTPQFVTENRGKPVDDIAASLYGKYRWQKLIRQELSARKAVEDRDYYRAEKEYISLLEEEKSEESLFDLAGIYKRLGLYGKEAEIYELMKEKSPLYPGLDQYINANVLKRQPRVATEYIIERKKGRDNYKNLKKNGYGAEVWLMPTYDQEASVSVTHNTYESYYQNDKTDSNRVIGSYSTYYKNSLDVNVSVGTEKVGEDSPDEVLYKFEVIGRLNPRLDLFARFEQDLVDDNIKSVTDSIMRRDFESGFKYDLFPRLFLGLDYRYRIYSDSNQQNRMKFWSSYHLFGEKNQVKLKYSYENLQNRETNIVDNGVFRYSSVDNYIDRAYWSPDMYWQHLFTLSFSHIFESLGAPESPLSYFSFDYSLGYEDNFDLSHEFDMNIFLEINRHFLLKGNLRNHDGEDYTETESTLSLIYRW